MGEPGREDLQPGAYADTDLGLGAEADAPALRDCQPVADLVEVARLAARLEQKLFGRSEPVRLGRYLVGPKLGHGGMGVVYRATDPELRRDVALKVLQPAHLGDERARRRLQEEARTLARLDHPAIVEIHDILFVDKQMVLVMPLLGGRTLADWARATQPSWRAVVEAYAQAGDGLAAAHSVGVVHRDFKPGNAMMLDDGRVRVLDFGLAHRPDTELEQGAASSGPTIARGSGDARLTAAGAVLGTRGYWAPEQQGAGVATAASDQFSFCAALHTALEGVVPFAGETVEEELANVRAGRVTTGSSDRHVPAWLRALIRRGLAADPADRFPSMKALLAELRRPRGWRRWRVPVLVSGSAVVALVAAFGTARAMTGPPPCDDGSDTIGTVWGLKARAQLATTLASVPSPALDAMRPQIVGQLDAYRERWQTLRVQACVEHRGGHESAALLDRRGRCLKRRLDDLGAAMNVLKRVDRATATNALATVTGLPSLEQCADLERFEASAPPPPPAQQSAVDAIRQDLATARALDDGGRSLEARELSASALADAESLGFEPVIAEAALLHGTILVERQEDAAAVPPLTRAKDLALIQGRLALAVEAGARRMFVEGLQEVPPEERARLFDRLAEEARTLEPLSQGLVDDKFARPLLLNNLSAVAVAAGDRARADQLLEQAHAAVAGIDDPDIELSAIDMNLGMRVADPASRQALLHSVWERRRAKLGDAHVSTLEALDVYSLYEPDLEAAASRMTMLDTAYRQEHPDRLADRAATGAYRAFLAEHLGHHDQALALYRENAALPPPPDEPGLSFWSQLATGHALRLSGDPAGAIAAYLPVAVELGSSRSPWVRTRAAEAELGLGLAELARHRPDLARPHLQAAAAIYDDAAAESHKVEYTLRAALAHQ